MPDSKCMSDKGLWNYLWLSKRRALVFWSHGWEQWQSCGLPARQPSALPGRELSAQTTSSPFNHMEMNNTLHRRPGRGISLEKCRKKTASGETRILWDSPIFHNFQESCTKAWKTTSTKAFNSSVLPAYHLNKSVSGETKDKEKLPVVPDSLCSRGCWKKIPQQDIFAFEVGGRRRGGEGISPETLEARTIRTFLHFVWKWISSALPAQQQSLEMLLLSAPYWLSQAWEEAKTSLHHFAGHPPGRLWNPTKLNCFQLVSSWIFVLLVGFKKNNKYFPTSAI